MSIEVPKIFMRSRHLLVGVAALAFVACGHNRAAAATLTANDATQLQSAFDNAVPGDVIMVQAGTTFVGDFTLPAKSGSGYITVRSSAQDSVLPAAGQRTDPSYAAYLPKLQGRFGPAVLTNDGAHHWRFENIEFLPNPGNPTVPIIALGALDTHQTSVSLLPHDIILDRIYVHDDAGGSKRAIQLNAASSQIINSYVAGIRRMGQEAQAICGWNGPGPFIIENNYLEAAGENVLFGGSDPDVTGLIASDITFRRNYLSKPLAWRAQGWTVKNVFELKNAQRVLIDANVFENSWANAQVGFLVLFTGLNDGGRCTWCTVKDITFTNNVVRHGNGGMQLSGHNSYTIPANIGPAATNILIKNNLFYDINQSFGGSSPLGMWIQIGDEISNVTVDHNTVQQVNNVKPTIMITGTTPLNGISFKNNFFNRGQYGVFAGGPYGEGNSSITPMFPGGVFQQNVIVDEFGSHPSYPSSTTFISLATFNSQFVDWANANYRLVPSSPYKNAATDGTDIGVNMDSLLTPSGSSGGTSGTPAAQGPSAPTNVRIVAQ
jgi:hypothetical protein